MSDYASPLHAMAAGAMRRLQELRDEKKRDAQERNTNQEMGIVDSDREIQPTEAGPNGMARNDGEHEEGLASAVARKAPGNPFFSPFVRDLQARGLAVGHPDLQQSETNLGPTVRAGSDAQAYVGQGGFGGDLAQTDMPPGADNGQPHVQLWDAAANAGHSGLLDSVRHDLGQEHATGHYGPARGSATPDNGTHEHGSQFGALTTPRESMKASSRLDVIKQAMRDQGLL